MYVCVILNDVDHAPTYYVLPPEEVQKRGRWYRTRAILNIGDLKGSGFEGAWHLVESELNKARYLPV